MSTTKPTSPVPMQRGRRADRTLLARLRAERPWAFRHRSRPNLDAGILLLRVAVGATFVAHGIDKLVDLPAATHFFDTLGIPMPGAMAPFVAAVETAGGLALIAGLATPLVGVALAGDMLVAYATAHLGHGFFAISGGGELVLLLGAASLSLALTGAHGSRPVSRGIEERTCARNSSKQMSTPL